MSPLDPHDKAIIHGSSESDYRTPPDAFGLLNREFDFQVDAAANGANALCTAYFGPGSLHAEDALAVDWSTLGWTRYFINPPFSKTLVNAYNTGRIKINGEWVGHEIDPVKAGWYDVANWAKKCWKESQRGATIVGVFPFAPQTDWYRQYVYGHSQGHNPPGETKQPISWNGHATREERRLPHRISFLQPDGTPTGNAGVNSVILVWKPNHGIVGPWQPWPCYWSYR